MRGGGVLLIEQVDDFLGHLVVDRDDHAVVDLADGSFDGGAGDEFGRLVERFEAEAVAGGDDAGGGFDLVPDESGVTDLFLGQFELGGAAIGGGIGGESDVTELAIAIDLFVQLGKNLVVALRDG